MKKRTVFIITGIFVAVVTLALLGFLILRLAWLSNEMESRNELLIGEIRSSREMTNVLMQGFISAAGDINGIRRILGLEETTYNFPDETEEDESLRSESLQFFRGLDTIIAKNQAEKLSLGMDTFQNSDTFAALPAGLELIRPSEDKFELKTDKYVYFVFEWDGESESIRVSPAAGKPLLTSFAKSESSYFSKTLPEIETYIENMENEFNKFLGVKTDSRIIKVLLEAGLSLERSEDDYGLKRDRYQYMILRFDKTTGTYFVNDSAFTSYDSFINAVLEKVPELDVRSSEEKLIDWNKEEIAGLAFDEGFLSLLAAKDLSIESVPREDSDYFYFDLLNQNDARIGSFAVQKMIGKIYLMDKDDVPISDIRTNIDAGKKN
jgi:hypothetical protein